MALASNALSFFLYDTKFITFPRKILLLRWAAEQTDRARRGSAIKDAEPVQEGGDSGRPIVISRPDSASAVEFQGLAERVLQQVTATA